jgi:hypothetical protein
VNVNVRKFIAEKSRMFDWALQNLIFVSNAFCGNRGGDVAKAAREKVYYSK